MRKLREIIRLKVQAGQSGRAIAPVPGAIAIAGLAWPLPPEFDDDAALERLLFPDEHRPVSNRPDRVGVAVRAYRTCSSVGRRFRQQQAEAVVRALKA